MTFILGRQAHFTGARGEGVRRDRLCRPLAIYRPYHACIRIGAGCADCRARWVRTLTRAAMRRVLNFTRDTRVLLCSTEKGEVIPLTENHHADARVEAVRLRRMMGSGLIADSFGEIR